MAKKLLITGGAGFIGVNAALRFLGKGWDVTIFDNFSRRGTDINEATLKSGSFPGKAVIVRGDVRTDTNQLGALAEEHDAVLHLAAQVAVTTSVTNPREDFESNALGTFNVLEAVRLSKRRPAVLYTSTNKVYGGLENLAVKEEERRYAFVDQPQGVDEFQLLDFHSPYGCSKGTADQYVRDYARLYDMKTVVFRQSCIYGPHQMGIEDQGWVAWFLIAALLGKPVTIYGNGKQVRDLLYVDDLVSCYEAAIDKIDVCAGRIYNLGGGASNTLSLLEFFNILKKEFGTDVPLSYAKTRPGDQPIFISDNGKALRELGWKPTTEVHAGLRQLHDWLKANMDRLKTLYAK
jgi:CDP-paratose 2-epimerase